MARAYVQNAKPGPQDPNRYAPYGVGPNYQKWGELPGYVYNPITDAYRVDPKAAEELAKRQGLVEEPPGLMSTLGPVLGITAGATLANSLASSAGGSIHEALPSLGEIFNGGFLGLGGSQAPALGSAVSGASGVSAVAPYGTMTYGGEAVGTLMAPEAAAVANPGMFSLGGIGSAGNVILPAAGAIGAYDLLTNDRGPFLGAAEGAASGAAIGSFFPGAGTLIGAGVGGLIGLGKGLFGEHKSTKEHQAERWGELADRGVAGAAETYNVMTNLLPEDLRGKFASGPNKGKKWDFNLAVEEAMSGANATGLREFATAAYGNYDTFGNDWMSYTPEQQDQITLAGMKEGLYKGDKGDIIVTNKERLREIKDQVLGVTKEPAPAVQLTA